MFDTGKPGAFSIPVALSIPYQNILFIPVYLQAVKNNYTITNNEQLMHFEIREGDSTAFLEYRFSRNNIAFMHTEVPPGMEGKGVAGALAAYAFEYAASIDKKVMVYCPFVATYVKRHPELQPQVFA